MPPWSCLDCGAEIHPYTGAISTDYPGPPEPTKQHVICGDQEYIFGGTGTEIRGPARCLVCDQPVLIHPGGELRGDCPGPPQPSPAVAAADEPDPDEVRRAWMANPQFRTLRERELVDAAIAAWLRLREQQPAEPAPTMCDAPGCDLPALAQCNEHVSQQPTIAQVIEACGAVGDWQLVVTPSLSGRPVARVDQWDASAGDWTKLATSGPCDTPEAAIRALYDDAVAKLRDTRDAAVSKLEKLGVK